MALRGRYWCIRQFSWNCVKWWRKYILSITNYQYVVCFVQPQANIFYDTNDGLSLARNFHHHVWLRFDFPPNAIFSKLHALKAYHFFRETVYTLSLNLQYLVHPFCRKSYMIHASSNLKRSTASSKTRLKWGRRRGHHSSQWQNEWKTMFRSGCWDNYMEQ